MTEPTTVDINIYRLQQDCYNDPKAAAKAVYERLVLAGIPVEISARNEITAKRGTLLHSLGPVYLSYQWIPSDHQLDFGDFLKQAGDNL